MGIQRFPNLLHWTVLACRLPYPGDPIECKLLLLPLWFLALPPPNYGFGDHIGLFEAAEFTPSLFLAAHVTAREAMASPPFEDVYVRAFADRVTPSQRRI